MATLLTFHLISVVEARNLDVYAKREQVYYVQLNYGKQTFKTKPYVVKPSGISSIPQNAEWNELFTVYVSC